MTHMVEPARPILITPAVGAGHHRNPAASKIIKVQRRVACTTVVVRLIGSKPHLDEVRRARRRFHRGLVGVVALGVDNARAGTHPLNLATVDHPTIAVRVSMHKRARQHPGHDVDASMRMIGVTGTALREVIVVANNERGERHVVRVVVVLPKEKQ